MQSYLLPPFATAPAPSAPTARSSSTADRDGFAQELESRIAGSRDRQRASPPERTDLDHGPSAELTDGRDRRPDRLTSDRAEPHDDIKPAAVDVPSEPSADSPDEAPSDEVTPGTAIDPGTAGDSRASSFGAATPFNIALSPAPVVLPQDSAGSADVGSTEPAAKGGAQAAPVAATPATQPVTNAEASPLFLSPLTEAGSSAATGDGTQNAATQAVAAQAVSTVSGRTPAQRGERRPAGEPVPVDLRAGSTSARNDPLVSPLEPLRASVLEEGRTDGAGDGASASQDDPNATPNPATQLARTLVELAGGSTGPSEPIVTTGVDTTSEAPALSPNIVAVADIGVAAPAVAPTPVAQGSGATSDVAGVTQAPTTDADAPLQDVVKFVAGNVGSRNAHVRIQLDPPELGAMRIDIRTQQQTLTVRIEVETADALARIQSGAAQLKQSLEQHGLVVERFDVHLRPADSASPQSEGGDARDDRLADPRSSFERDRPENESSHGEEPSSAGPGADADELIEDTGTRASDRGVRRSTLTAASVDLWA